MPHLPRVARVAAIAGLVALLAIPSAIAPGPTLIPGQVHFTNAGISGEGANLTNLYTYNQTIGGRLWIGNATASYLESTTEGRIDTNSTLKTDRSIGIGAAPSGNVKLHVQTPVTSSANAQLIMAPSLGAGSTTFLGIGAALTNYNSAFIGFRNAGTDSTSNALTFGLYGVDNALNVMANGNIGVGTLTDVNSKLTLPAATTAAGGIAFGTDTTLYRSAADTLKTDDTLVVPYLRIEANAQPTCNASTKGTFEYSAGGAGAADVLYMCMKSAADTYSWKAIMTG